MKTFAIIIAMTVNAAAVRADEPTTVASEKATQRWIDQLGSERFKEREQASRELSKLGNAALANLKAAMLNADPEVSRRAQQLVERIEAPMGPPVPLEEIRPFLKIFR